MIETKQGVVLKQLDDEGAGLARIATLNVIDSDGDVTISGAFGEQIVQLLPAHSWGSVPLGKARVFEKGDEALAEFQINLETSAGKDWHSALKFDLSHHDPIQEWSYGYRVIESTTEDRDGKRVRILEKLKVSEVSPVILGAGVDTATLAIKGGGGKSGLTLVEQVNAALADAEAVAVRLREVKELRGKDDRSLGADTTMKADELQIALAHISALITELKGLTDEGSLTEAGHLLAQFEASRLPPHILAAINAVKK